jgi:hypothetical protein
VLELKEVQQDLIVEIGIMSKADNDYLITVSRVFSLAKRAKKIFESSEIPEKRQFINYLIQNPTLNNNKLSFTVTEPFKLILNLSDNPVWLGRQDSNLQPPAPKTVAIPLGHVPLQSVILA